VHFGVQFWRHKITDGMQDTIVPHKDAMLLNGACRAFRTIATPRTERYDCFIRMPVCGMNDVADGSADRVGRCHDVYRKSLILTLFGEADRTVEVGHPPHWW
jgi:hypothetical protein